MKYRNQKSTYTKPADTKPSWHVIDAKDYVLGRLATQVASLIRGKKSVEFTPSVDTGDFVIVINAEKVLTTGNKMEDKRYYRHSGYPGGLKTQTLKQKLAKKPESAIELAVKGMLPKNSLGRKLFTKLKVYSGPEHPHEAQNPIPYNPTK